MRGSAECGSARMTAAAENQGRTGVSMRRTIFASANQRASSTSLDLVVAVAFVTMLLLPARAALGQDPPGGGGRPGDVSDSFTGYRTLSGVALGKIDSFKITGSDFRGGRFVVDNIVVSSE